MKIFIGSDHRGFKLKEFLKEELTKDGFEVIDCGNTLYDPNDDYPDFAFKVGEEVSKINNSQEAVGIVICGSGGGVCFSVNKIKNIRGALAFNPEMAKKLREDDDINVLCLASDFLDELTSLEIVKAFLTTPFKNEEKYVRRIKKVQDYENRSYSSS